MRQSESGNVFFYIFVAISLLAALSYAVAQGGRGSVKALTGERVHLVASEIIAYGDTVSKTVTQLRLRGTPVTSLSFANAFLSSGEYGVYNSDPGNEVFNPAGGAVVYSNPPEATTVINPFYDFLANNEVENVGTTCGASSCSDLVMSVSNVRLDVCLELNEILGIVNPAGAPPTDTDIRQIEKFKPGATPFGYSSTIGDEDAALDGQREACFQETGDSLYYYYKVLLPR